MENIDIGAELAAVKKALDDQPGPTITGSQLAALIRFTVPDLDVRALVGIPKGPGAVAEFVRLHLSDVVQRISYESGDPIYQINDGGGATVSAPATAQIWRTFVSPNSPLRLVLSPGTRNLVVRSAPASLSESELEVAKASRDEHDRMRAEFEATMQATQVAALREHVSTGTEFVTWIEALKEHLPEAAHEWGHYRRRHLAELFQARIMELQLDESLQQEILEQIKVSEIASYNSSKAEKFSSNRPNQTATGGLNKTSAANVKARTLAHAAIDKLSYDELRALKIPLGAMLDAIRAEA